MSPLCPIFRGNSLRPTDVAEFSSRNPFDDDDAFDGLDDIRFPMANASFSNANEQQHQGLGSRRGLLTWLSDLRDLAPTADSTFVSKFYEDLKKGSTEPDQNAEVKDHASSETDLVSDFYRDLAKHSLDTKRKGDLHNLGPSFGQQNLQPNTLVETLTQQLVRLRGQDHASRPIIAGFLFSGNDGDWHTMGKDLIRNMTAQKTLRNIDRYLRDLGCEWSLMEQLLLNEKRSNIKNPPYADPMQTALQIAAVDMLKEAGVKPRSVLGHGAGEIAATYAAGALRMRDAVKLAYFRGHFAACCEAERRTINSNNPKTWRARMEVAAGPLDVLDYMRDGRRPLNVDVACINSPWAVTCAGEALHLLRLRDWLRTNGVACQGLARDTGCNTRAMERVQYEYQLHIGTLDPGFPGASDGDPPAAVFSTVNGLQVPVAKLQRPEHWVKNLVEPVVFNFALESLLDKAREDGPDDGVNCLLVVGPEGRMVEYVEETVRGMRHVFV